MNGSYEKGGMIHIVDNEKVDSFACWSPLGNFDVFFLSAEHAKKTKTIHWNEHVNFKCWVHLMIKLYNHSESPKLDY